MSLKQMRILVVEDEFYQAEAMKVLLAEAGAQVIGPFAYAEHAATMLSSAPDAAVLDIKLADEASYDLADMLQAKGIPFVFVSGYGRNMIPERFVNAPYLLKPVDPAELISVLASVSVRPRPDT